MKIAACLIVKDEVRDIAEWIAYHSILGIDTFLVYDNGSSDGTLAMLAAAARLVDVRVTPWRSHPGTIQFEAYEHALHRNRNEFDWIAIIDSDEFLVIHPPNTLHRLCAAAPNADAIGVNWAMFGSNGHVDLPQNMVIEAFTRRSDPEFGPNRHVKSLVRPSAFVGCLNSHAFAVNGRSVRPDGSDLAWLTTDGILQPGTTAALPDYTVAQLNHYFTRSRAHWLRKTARGYFHPSSLEKLSYFDFYDRNEVEDRSALRFLPSVLARRTAILDKALSTPTRPIGNPDARQSSPNATAAPARPRRST